MRANRKIEKGEWLVKEDVSANRITWRLRKIKRWWQSRKDVDVLVVHFSKPVPDGTTVTWDGENLIQNGNDKSGAIFYKVFRGADKRKGDLGVDIAKVEK